MSSARDTVSEVARVWFMETANIMSLGRRKLADWPRMRIANSGAVVNASSVGLLRIDAALTRALSIKITEGRPSRAVAQIRFASSGSSAVYAIGSGQAPSAITPTLNAKSD